MARPRIARAGISGSKRTPPRVVGTHAGILNEAQLPPLYKKNAVTRRRICASTRARDSLELRLDASELVGGEGGGHCNVYSGSNRAVWDVRCVNEVTIRRRNSPLINPRKTRVPSDRVSHECGPHAAENERAG